jgi:hypothetical protein
MSRGGQIKREDAGYVYNGLTQEGRYAVLSNIFHMVTHEFHKLCMEVVTPGGCAWAYNAYIYRVATGLQSLLDSIARFCSDVYGETLDSSEKIYFDTFFFYLPDLQRVRVCQAGIKAFRYDGMTFNDLANRIKHEVQWVGLRQTAPDGIIDVFDDEKTGLVFGVLAGVYQHTKTIMSLLKKDGV